MTNGKEPSRSVGHPQGVNPYAATLVDGPHSPIVNPDTKVEKRSFQLRMDWSDRRTFLRIVGLLRFTAVAGAVVGFSGLYSMGGAAYSSWILGSLATWAEPLVAARWLLVLVKAGLGFYACWLQWIFADALAATAGGRTNRMRDWSTIQLRIAWLAVIMLTINIASSVWEWVVIQLMSTTPFGL
jgi:hypothetical protein